MQRLRRWYAWFVRRAPRFRDLMFIGFSLLTIVAQAASGGGGWGPRDWFVLGAGAVASLALWWRRSHPVTVTIIAIVALASAQIFVPAGLALLTLAIRRRDAALLFLTLAAYAAYVGSYWRGNSQPYVLFFTGPFLIGAWVAAGSYIGARRDLMVSLRDRAERAEAERELRAEQVRLGERARIAQEMHDILAHKVSLIALHAGGLEVNPAVGAEKVESSAGLIRETARQAMEDLRDVLGVLRTDVSVDGADLAPVPRAADLARLVASIPRGRGERDQRAHPAGRRTGSGRTHDLPDRAGGADQCPQACAGCVDRGPGRGRSRYWSDRAGGESQAGRG